MKRYVIALDQGTTSSRALLIDESAQVARVAQKEFTQIFPHPGWVEHDPEEIWQTQEAMLHQVIAHSGIAAEQIAGIGITNQRETTVVWNADTGEPIHNAIVWQDRRTAPLCEELRNEGLEAHIRETTGLVIDAYFSGTKIAWILENVDGARALANAGKLRFGTIDTWLIWKLTGGAVHITDYTNASRTLLYDIRNLCWDETLTSRLGIPPSMLPEVKDSSGEFGIWHHGGCDIPICGVAGDQQAALFGQACFEPGSGKNTYGTGCFMLLNIGEEPRLSEAGLLTTIAWGIGGKITYALEGSVFIAGAAVQWLRDGLGIIEDSAETEAMANSLGDAHDVFVVPAFSGLGAPHWDMYARGAIFGLTRDTGRAHLARATLESLAYQTRDVLDAMRTDSGLALSTLKVDGGAAENTYLMQFQADILNVPVELPAITESTAMGAAFLAGLHLGMWDQDAITQKRTVQRVFEPAMTEEKRESLYRIWKRAVERTSGWLEH